MEDNTKILMEVGAASYKALKYAKGILKPGISATNFALKVESYIREEGYKPAFPINISVNNEAAHYTAGFEDDRVFTENDIIKIDTGCYKDGLSGDCALSVDLSGKYQNLIDGSQKALEAALSIVRDGVKTSHIGRVIAKELSKYNAHPVINLGGHGLEEDNLHSGSFIPNYDDGSLDILHEGDVVSIEPFSTNGRGYVADSNRCEIYSYINSVKPRSPYARHLLDIISQDFNATPFAARWLVENATTKFALYSSLNELVKAGAIVAHPVLIETSGGIVAQSEVTLIVEKDSCSVITK